MPNNNPQQQASQREGSSKLTDRIEKTADQTTNSAIQRVRDAREQATSGLEHQRAEVASRIRRIGGVIRAGSETLSTDDPYSQNLLTVAGERVVQVADYIENLTPGQVADDLQTFARRRPGLFFGSAFLIGLGLGRFAKSTTRAGSPRSDSYGDDSSYDDEDFATADYTGESSTATQQRTAGIGQSSPSYGSTGSSGSSSGSYGVGGTGGTGSTGTAGTSTLTGAAGTSALPGSGTSTGASTTGSTGYGQGVGGTGGYGVGSTAPQGTGTPSAPSTTPKETDRGQGSKS